MGRVRMPACGAIPLSGETTTSGLTVTIDEENAIYKTSKNQAKTLGNKCGHDKNNFKKPAFYDSTGGLFKRPYAIKAAIHKIGRIIDFRYYKPKQRHQLLSNLSNHNRISRRLYRSDVLSMDKEEFFRIFYHSTSPNGSKRAKRSEHIEASLSLVIRALLFRTDLHTMAYGHRDNRNKTIYHDYSDLIEDSKISYSRLKRVMKSLKALGIITVKRILKEIEGGRTICTETQIHLTEKIFQWLDLEGQLLKDKRYALAENFKKQVKIDEQNRSLKEFLPPKNTHDKIDIKIPSIKPNHISYTAAQNKEVLNIAEKILKDNPGMALRDAIKIASERNKAPPN